MFTVLARAAASCMGDFNALNLANTAWAFAKVARVDQSDAQLFMILGSVVKWRVYDFSEQNLANIAWAFATMGQ